MSVNTDQTKQRPTKPASSPPSKPENEDVSLTGLTKAYESGGAMGVLDRVGDVLGGNLNQLYSGANMNRAFDQVMDAIPPEIKASLQEFLKQLFNFSSGASDEEPGNRPGLDGVPESREYQALGELYGSKGATSDAIRMDSNFAQRDDDNFAAGVTTGTGMGGINEVNGIQYVNGKPINDGNDDDTDYMEAMGEQAERQERDRERLWDRTKHSVAGMELTGEEIDGLIEYMSDPATRKKLIDRRAKDKGISTEQAEKDVDNARRYLELTKLRDTGKLTPEQETEWRRLDKDPATRETVQSSQAERFEEKYGKPSTAAAQVGQVSARASESTSMGADVLDSTFANAPALQKHFVEATAATAPLDAAKIAQPLSVASAAPPPQVESAGFGV